MIGRKKFKKRIRIDEVIHEQLPLRRKKLRKGKNQKKEKSREGIWIDEVIRSMQIGWDKKKFNLKY